MDRQNIPPWLTVLDGPDLQFIRRFILASGSLKAMAREYAISYPTVRIRLDRLIEKVRLADSDQARDPFEQLVQGMVIDGKITADAAAAIRRAHQQSFNKKAKNDGSMV